VAAKLTESGRTITDIWRDEAACKVLDSGDLFLCRSTGFRDCFDIQRHQGILLCMRLNRRPVLVAYRAAYETIISGRGGAAIWELDSIELNLRLCSTTTPHRLVDTARKPNPGAICGFSCVCPSLGQFGASKESGTNLSRRDGLSNTRDGLAKVIVSNHVFGGFARRFVYYNALERMVPRKSTLTPCHSVGPRYLERLGLWSLLGQSSLSRVDSRTPGADGRVIAMPVSFRPHWMHDIHVCVFNERGIGFGQVPACSPSRRQKRRSSKC